MPQDYQPYENITTGVQTLMFSLNRSPRLFFSKPDNHFKHFRFYKLAVGDRVWSLNICRSSGLTAVGTSATRGVPPLRLFDLRQGRLALDMGAELRNGAGQLHE